MLSDPLCTTLGPDPAHRTCALNGYAFQQDAIRSFNDWQYACFYGSLQSAKEPLFVHLSRRKLPDGPWQTLVFEDYPQTVDDGHNTVQLGICPGDGTIHLSYDHHCDVLRYRHSKVGVATSPEKANWGPELFTQTLSALPGLSSPKITELLSYITYPRFVTRERDLLFTFRTGKAGLGDDHLCVYTASSPSPDNSGETSAELGTYKFLGTHLKGVSNNPYIHGLDASPDGKRLYTTWVYREFVHYQGWDDPLDTKHKTQAGPNSAANNRDICYAWSEDGGTRWRSGSQGGIIADLERGESIQPTSPGIVAFEIPKGSGLINQEAQAIDDEGGVHILNRDSLDDGVLRWKHYYLPPDGAWTRRALPYVEGVYGGKRGQLAVSRDGDLYFVLPHHADPVLTILRASKKSHYAEYELMWQGQGFPPTEPLVDKARLGHDNVLSVFTRVLTGPEGKVDVTVLDFQLE
ncbi:hypothetical protein E0Z10_g4421 [Xylaria hypoxylon]|uniref:Dockerin type 1 n=1 Tax=Xylaria hypoxylon TaxID=37992 RepID=A0A4Z0YWS3_9PEZI|nr:hypothetical protein E0Z10_g4421 [Xylaria hypoxylon]